MRDISKSEFLETLECKTKIYHRWIEDLMNTEQAASQGAHPMDALLAQDFDLTIPKVGETFKGIVVAHNSNSVMVDIGAKSEGIISGRELESLDDEARERLAIGNEVSVFVTNTEDGYGNILLSYGQAMAEEDWKLAQELLENQEFYECEVVGFNKGGLLTKIGQVRAFIPASQLGGNVPRSETNEYLKEFVGQNLKTKVIEVDRSRNRLILSARAAMKNYREDQRRKLLQDINEGDICEGKVVNLERFGAFVDIGGLQGLVHLSELSWKRISNPRDELGIGDNIQVYVLQVDHEKQRVALSIKRLLPDPWTVIEDNYQLGQLVDVTITKLEPYGAFARLNDKYGLEGLIHISELAEERINSPADVVETKQIMTARIIRIDPKKRQLGLSLKQVSSGKYMELDLANSENNETLTASSENEE